MRPSLDFGDAPDVAVVGTGVSLEYARHWLTQIGLRLSEETGDIAVAVVDGHSADRYGQLAPVEIHVWDFQVGRSGTGIQASAVSGVSYVLGHPDAAPLALPTDMPEKWCGLFAATLALGVLVEVELWQSPGPRRYDVSAADILRAFADQNAGNHLEVEGGWRRNGRVAVEHGGIYPQGFFACRDGYVAIVGRSRKDWAAIRQLLDWPAWAKDPRYDDPFAIAEDSSEVDALLTAELKRFDRDELLSGALTHGATVAPVYSPEELRERDIVRPDFYDEDGHPSLPFRIRT